MKGKCSLRERETPDEFEEDAGTTPNVAMELTHSRLRSNFFPRREP
jgi:hypothetical protein